MKKEIEKKENPKEGSLRIESMVPEEAEALAEFFHSFGDRTRIRILGELSRGEISVNDLAEKLEMTQSAVSHQLRMLRQNRLIRGRREGKQVLYSLDDDHVGFILATGISHVREQIGG